MGHSKGSHPGRNDKAQVLGQLWLSKLTIWRAGALVGTPYRKKHWIYCAVLNSH